MKTLVLRYLPRTYDPFPDQPWIRGTPIAYMNHNVEDIGKGYRDRGLPAGIVGQRPSFQKSQGLTLVTLLW